MTIDDALNTLHAYVGHVRTEEAQAVRKLLDEYERLLGLWASQTAQRSKAEQTLEKAIAILQSIVTDEQADPCRYDHHGYCQAHGLQPKGECYMELTRSLLGGGEG